MKKMKYLVLALIAFTFFNANTLTDGYKVGDYAKDFKLKNIDGKMVSMADYKDAKGYIVIFTCNTCPYAKLYEDRIIALNTEFAPKGFPVIAINPNDVKKQPEDSFEKMKKKAADKKFNFPYLVDESQEVAKTYGATRTPHIYVLKKESSKYKVAYIGAIDNNYKSAEDATERYVEDAINSILSGKKVSKDFTKAVGCTIKWSES